MLPGKPKIEDQYVRPHFLDDRHDLEAIVDFPDDNVPGGLQNPAEPGPDQGIGRQPGLFEPSSAAPRDRIVDVVCNLTRAAPILRNDPRGFSTVRRPDSARASTGTGGGLSAATVDAVRRFSHDVVSPLMSVLALSEVLLLESRHDERLNEDLRRIHAAAEEALTLVRTLGAEIASDQSG